MANMSLPYATLQYYWEMWREKTGVQKPNYVEYIKIQNEAAGLNSVQIKLYSNKYQVMFGGDSARHASNSLFHHRSDYADAGEMWVSPYTGPDYNATAFKNEIDTLWNTTRWD